MRWLPPHRVHKWIAVCAGIFILVWVVSGIARILPSGWPKQNPPQVLTDFGKLVLSPAEAIAILNRNMGSTVTVERIHLRQILNFVVYEIKVKGGAFFLIDASSGRPFTITPEVGLRIVREIYGAPGRSPKIELIHHYDGYYGEGGLPAYRITFDGNSGTMYHIATQDGALEFSDPWLRARGAIASLHLFEPMVNHFTSSDVIRKGLLILAGIIGIAAVLTGYYLAVRRP